MDAQVPLQVVVEIEPCSTNVTREGFLPGVDDLMSFQSGAGSVGAVALVADKRAVAGVLPLVHRQRVGVLKGLFTHVAFVLLGICVDHLVEAQGVLAFKLLPTCGAAERSLL